MKKLFSYILILISLVGIFSPTFSIRAQSIYGTCKDFTGVNIIANNITRDACKALDPSHQWEQIGGTIVGTCTTKRYSSINPNPNPNVLSAQTEMDCNYNTRPKLENAQYVFVSWENKALPTEPKNCPGGQIWKVDKCVFDTIDTTKYTFLAPLPCDPSQNTVTDTSCDPATGKLKTFDPTQANNLGVYLNIMLRIFIGICAVLAVIMIILGGMEYITSELMESKAHGKERITNAIFGLVLALGAYVLLVTINPDLLSTDLSSLKTAEINVSAADFTRSPSTYIVPLGQTGKASGTNCDENAVAAANAGLTNAQIHTLACIGGIESGCNSVQNYNWNKGSSAYGPFQILLQGNAGCFESDACRQAAGVSGPLNCAAGFSGGNPIQGSPIVEQCKKAADNFACSVSAAACLIKKRPDYGDWNANPNLSKCL